jgi:hypothetical protein
MKPSRRIFTAIASGLVVLCIGLFLGSPQLRALGQSSWLRLIAFLHPKASFVSKAAQGTTLPSSNVTSSSELLELEGQKKIETQHSETVSEKAVRLQEIKALLVNDKICQLLQRKDLVEMDKAELAKLLDEKLTTAADLLIAPSGLANFSSAHDETARKFIYAIYVGGLLNGAPKPKALKLKTSYRLLSQLASDYPRNGIYLYFRAAVQSQLKQPQDKIKEDLTSMAEASLFEDPIMDVTKEIHQWGLQSPSLYYIGTLIIRDLPIPDYTPSNRLIKEFLDQSDENFRELIFDWGQRVSRRHEDASTHRDLVFWWALPYQIEISLSRMAWMKMNPNQEVPQELRKNYKDLIDRDPYQAKMWQASSEPERCEESIFHDILDSQIRDEETWRPSQD